MYANVCVCIYWCTFYINTYIYMLGISIYVYVSVNVRVDIYSSYGVRMYVYICAYVYESMYKSTEVCMDHILEANPKLLLMLNVRKIVISFKKQFDVCVFYIDKCSDNYLGTQKATSNWWSEDICCNQRKSDTAIKYF